MMKKWSALGGLAFAAILGSVFAFPAYAKEKTFPDGIYAGDFALGGQRSRRRNNLRPMFLPWKNAA